MLSGTGSFLEIHCLPALDQVPTVSGAQQKWPAKEYNSHELSAQASNALTVEEQSPPIFRYKGPVSQTHEEIVEGSLVVRTARTTHRIARVLVVARVAIWATAVIVTSGGSGRTGA